MKLFNPIAFRPAQVTFWTTLVYLALIIPLIYVQETVPPAPKSATPYAGIDMDDAWADLTAITRAYHPYNSRFNEEVREYLLQRIRKILVNHRADWGVEASWEEYQIAETVVDRSQQVTIFDDLVSNLTISTPRGSASTGEETCGVVTYFEGNNIIVYIRGTDDDEGDWWRKPPDTWSRDHRGVLVNAHFDSVSTGFGATDDGMGVVTVLQLISYFTHPSNRPKHGILALLNNAEEDYLWGARAFGKHPSMPFAHTFLNLEGAGAGGRALLFRTTDAEVTRAYSRSPHPFGSVVGSDGFSMGLIKSQTDYIVFNDIFGARGLDLAFYEPRSRYHTEEDDARHTSRASLWHMLSASIKTMEQLTGDDKGRFAGPRADGDTSKVQNGKGSDGVWFDIFGKAFVLFGLRTMFGWSLALLIATPLIFVAVSYVLGRYGKYYFFSNRFSSHDSVGGEDAVAINGWRGLFRFPLAFVISSGLVFGSALLVRKINPLIIYSSSYAVWAMMMSLFYFSFWTIVRGADAVRPSALHRGYVLMWLYALTWLVLIFVTVLEDRHRIAAGYQYVALQAAASLCFLISLCEFFALPSKGDFSSTFWPQNAATAPHETADEASDHESATSPSGSVAGASRPSTSKNDNEPEAHADERTPLIRSSSRGDNARTTFTTGYRRSIASVMSADTGTQRQNKKTPGSKQPFHLEQAWSAELPSWTWLLQFLLLAPVTILLVGQMGLFITAAMSATGADGTGMVFPYLLIALCSVVMLLPLTPFLHRVPHHLPMFMLAVFAGTLIYNLVAFPFSAGNRYKVFFQQTLDLDSGASNVTIDGLDGFVRPIIAEFPSSRGKEVHCAGSRRDNLVQCAYDGVDVLPNIGSEAVSKETTKGWTQHLVSVNVTGFKDEGGNKAMIEVDAVDTKTCLLSFNQRVTRYEIEEGTPLDTRFGEVDEKGLCQLRLWRRDWNKVWRVYVEWEDDGPSSNGPSREEEFETGSGELLARSEDGFSGEVSCMWADANIPGTIPALDEVLKYVPTWVVVSKLADGLVVGKKTFSL